MKIHGSGENGGEGASFHEDYLPYLVSRASFLILADFHSVLKPFRMPVQTWRVLAALSGGRRLPIGQLARITLSQQPTLSKLVDRLAAQGLVRRVGSQADGRRSLVVLTARGERRIAPVLVAAQTHELQFLAGFSPAEVASFKRLLRRFSGRLEPAS